MSQICKVNNKNIKCGLLSKKKLVEKIKIKQKKVHRFLNEIFFIIFVFTFSLKILKLSMVIQYTFQKLNTVFMA